VNTFVDVDGVEVEDILGFKVLFLLGITLLFGVRLEIVIDYAGEG
jgi:hypothetical protein